MRSLGSAANAIAIIARCRRPPLSWWAYSSTRPSARGTPTSRSSSMARARAAFALIDWCNRIASTIWLPTVCTGLNEVIGSWKMSPISPPLIARISAPSALSCTRSTAPLPSFCCRLAVSPSCRLRAANSLQQNLAADDAPGAIDDPQDRARGDALPAAALADNAQGPARENVEAGAIDRFDQPIILEEVGLQVTHG